MLLLVILNIKGSTRIELAYDGQFVHSVQLWGIAHAFLKYPLTVLVRKQPSTCASAVSTNMLRSGDFIKIRSFKVLGLVCDDLLQATGQLDARIAGVVAGGCSTQLCAQATS